MNFFINSVNVLEGYLYEVMGEDSLLHCYDCYVEAIVDGDIYRHNHVFKGCFKDEFDGMMRPNMGCRNQAQALADRVAAAGKINIEHWTLVGNLSERPVAPWDE